MITINNDLLEKLKNIAHQCGASLEDIIMDCLEAYVQDFEKYGA